MILIRTYPQMRMILIRICNFFKNRTDECTPEINSPPQARRSAPLKIITGLHENVNPGLKKRLSLCERSEPGRAAGRQMRMILIYNYHQGIP